jgi:stage II sporulation protein D
MLLTATIHRRTLVVLPLLAVLIGSLLGPAAAMADGPTTVTPIDPATAITFFGRGWGHGVGMSQYGARGRALAGQTSTEILAHYYAGTTLGTSNPATQIRVLVLTGYAATAARKAIFFGRRGSWTVDGIAKTFPADARLNLWPTALGSTTWNLKVTSSTGAVLHRATVRGALAMRPAAAATRLQVYSRPSSYDLYRGVVRIYLGTTVRVVNELGLDAYLRGVVPAEMPATWPAEALKAQAIAARSYAARRLRPGISNYDVVDDTRAQVYLGVRGEQRATNVAIASTAGIVLRSGTSIANALFHSTGGGATENNENVFVAASGAIVAGPVSYLRGSLDRAPDGTSYDTGAPFATWQTAPYTGDQLSAIFANDARTSVGALTALDLSNRGVSGRLIRVTLVGALGSKTVSGDVFRSVFNAWRPATDPQLRSSLFDTQPIP